MIPVAWGFDIVNFVWWIGIGHAGTLISAILLLLRQKWRQSINRFAEAMTFAVARWLFPLLHLTPWLRIGCFLPSTWESSHSSAAWWGTSLRFPPISRFRCCSGTLG
jgi:molybdopterin-containing oxidoreductase family membrane subunit